MSRSDLTIYDSLAQSNIPRDEKSAIRRWFDGLSMGQMRPYERPRVGRGETAIKTARAVGEAGVTAAALAYLQSERKTGLDMGSVPIDGAVGGMGTIFNILFPNTEVAEDVKNIVNSATSIFLFRKFSQVLEAKKRLAEGASSSSDSKMAGEETDSVLEAAKNL